MSVPFSSPGVIELRRRSITSSTGGVQKSTMLLIISRKEDRHELESKVLTAAFRQSVERGDVDGSRLAHRELVGLLARKGQGQGNGSGDPGLVFATDNEQTMDLEIFRAADNQSKNGDSFQLAEPETNSDSTASLSSGLTPKSLAALDQPLSAAAPEPESAGSQNSAKYDNEPMPLPEEVVLQLITGNKSSRAPLTIPKLESKSSQAADPKSEESEKSPLSAVRQLMAGISIEDKDSSADESLPEPEPETTAEQVVEKPYPKEPDLESEPEPEPALEKTTEQGEKQVSKEPDLKSEPEPEPGTDPKSESDLSMEQVEESELKPETEFAENLETSSAPEAMDAESEPPQGLFKETEKSETPAEEFGTSEGLLPDLEEFSPSSEEFTVAEADSDFRQGDADSKSDSEASLLAEDDEISDLGAAPPPGPSEYIDFGTEEEHFDESASIVYASIDFGGEEDKTASAPASIADLMAQRPAAEADSPDYYRCIGAEATDPFFLIHVSYLHAVRRHLRRQFLEDKSQALNIIDFKRNLKAMSVAFNILFDPMTRADYDLRRCGLREPDCGEGLTVPADASSGESGGKVKFAAREHLILCRMFDPEQMLAIANAARLLDEARLWDYLRDSNIVSPVELDSIRSGFQLIRNGLISISQFEHAFHYVRAHQQQLLEILLSAGWITVDQLQDYANSPEGEDLPEAPRFVEVALPKSDSPKIDKIQVGSSLPSWMDWGDNEQGGELPANESLSQDSSVAAGDTGDKQLPEPLGLTGTSEPLELTEAPELMELIELSEQKSEDGQVTESDSGPDSDTDTEERLDVPGALSDALAAAQQQLEQQLDLSGLEALSADKSDAQSSAVVLGLEPAMVMDAMDEELKRLMAEIDSSISEIESSLDREESNEAN